MAWAPLSKLRYRRENRRYVGSKGISEILRILAARLLEEEFWIIVLSLITEQGTLKRELSEFIERSRLLKKQEGEPVKISNKVTSSDGIKCLINLFYSFHILFSIIITF